jgi:long-chain fatty acid transport protein
MSKQTMFLVLVVALIGQLAWVPPVAAGGLYVAEFATSDMGAAGSGSLARGGDAASAMGNPATMTRLDSHQLQMGLAPGVSVVEFDLASDTPVPPGGNNGGDQGGFIPLLGSSYVHKVSDRIRAGMGLFSISGAALSPKGNWAGRRQVTDIQLFSISFVPTVAYQVTDWLSVGLGTGITYATLDWKLKLPGEIKVKLDDLDDWSAAAIVGLLIEPNDKFRVGITYQSETHLKLDGDLKGLAPAGLDLTLELPLAHAIRADAIWQATDDWAFSFGTAIELWSALKDTDVDLGPVESEVRLGFKDTWKLRAGVHHQLNESWMVQTGLSYDSSALGKKDRMAALPIDEQWRWGIGGTYAWSESKTIGFAFQYLNLGQGKIDNAALKGDYKDNEILFFVFNINFAQLPWDGRGTF